MRWLRWALAVLLILGCARANADASPKTEIGIGAGFQSQFGVELLVHTQTLVDGRLLGPRIDARATFSPSRADVERALIAVDAWIGESESFSGLRPVYGSVVYSREELLGRSHALAALLFALSEYGSTVLSHRFEVYWEAVVGGTGFAWDRDSGGVDRVGLNAVSLRGSASFRFRPGETIAISLPFVTVNYEADVYLGGGSLSWSAYWTLSSGVCVSIDREARSMDVFGDVLSMGRTSFAPLQPPGALIYRVGFMATFF